MYIIWAKPVPAGSALFWWTFSFVTPVRSYFFALANLRQRYFPVKSYFFALANLRQRYFSPFTVISRAPSWLSWFDAVPIKTLFSFSRFSFSIFNLASCRATSACKIGIKKMRTQTLFYPNCEGCIIIFLKSYFSFSSISEASYQNQQYCKPCINPMILNINLKKKLSIHLVYHHSSGKEGPQGKIRYSKRKDAHNSEIKNCATSRSNSHTHHVILWSIDTDTLNIQNIDTNYV